MASKLTSSILILRMNPYEPYTENEIAMLCERDVECKEDAHALLVSSLTDDTGVHTTILADTTIYWCSELPCSSGSSSRGRESSQNADADTATDAAVITKNEDAKRRRVSGTFMGVGLSHIRHHADGRASPQSQSMVQLSSPTSPSISLLAPSPDSLPRKRELEIEVKNKRETLRKLKLTKLYHERHSLPTLHTLTQKWKDVCQRALEDLQRALPQCPNMLSLLQDLGIDVDMVGYSEEENCFK